MDLDSSLNHEPAGDPGHVSQQPAAFHSRAIWHRPLITIMNMKRTMFFGGSFVDGLNGTSGS